MTSPTPDSRNPSADNRRPRWRKWLVVGILFALLLLFPPLVSLITGNWGWTTEDGNWVMIVTWALGVVGIAIALPVTKEKP